MAEEPTMQMRTGVAQLENLKWYVVQETSILGMRARVEVLAGPFDTDPEATAAAALVADASRRAAEQLVDGVADAHVEHSSIDVVLSPDELERFNRRMAHDLGPD